MAKAEKETMESKIQTLAVELLKKLGIEATAEVEAKDEGYSVQINSTENALLIGKHGNTLSSFESILSLMVNRGSQDFKRITVEIGGYRQEREEYLKDLVERLREEVIETGAEKRISGLKPWERRLVHMFLAETPEVETESTGEERERVLIIRKK